MQKKRILIFSFAYDPHIGGAEVAVKEITDRLGSDLLFDMVTYRFSNRDKEEEKIGNVTVYRVSSWGKHLFPVFAFFKALSLHRKLNYDAIWSVMASYAGFAAVLFKIFKPYLFGRQAKVKFLLTLQEGDPIPYIKRRAMPLWPLFVQIFKRADAVQAISHYLADFARDMGATCPVLVVPNAVDVDRFANAVGVSKKEDEVVLVTTSRLVPKNAVEDVIAAMPLLPDNIRFDIAGTGPLEESLKRQAKMLGVADRVRFLGFVSQIDLPKLLKSADIFIRTPLSEGFGNSFVEAFAAGLPVITTPVGGIVDFLNDRETGLFAKVRNHQSIADAVMELIRNPDLVSKIKRNAFELVKEKYDWSIVSDEMKKIFYEL